MFQCQIERWAPFASSMRGSWGLPNFGIFETSGLPHTLLDARGGFLEWPPEVPDCCTWFEENQLLLHEAELSSSYVHDSLKKALVGNTPLHEASIL